MALVSRVITQSLRHIFCWLVANVGRASSSFLEVVLRIFKGSYHLLQNYCHCDCGILSITERWEADGYAVFRVLYRKSLEVLLASQLISIILPQICSSGMGIPKRRLITMFKIPVHCGRTVRCSFAIRPPPGPGRTETLRRLYCRFVMWRSPAV